MEKKEDFLVAHYQTLNDSKFDFRNANLFTLVASKVTGVKVVDIGCGSGFFATILTTQGKEVCGIEPNVEMRELASKSNPQITVIPGRAEDVDVLIDKPVDTVVMLDVLEHVQDDTKQVQKVSSVLKAEGAFVIVVPAHPILFGERDKGMHHYRRYTTSSLRNILTEQGFEITIMRHWNMLGFFPYLLSEKVFHKPLPSTLRGNARVGFFGRALRSILNFWFKYVENVFDFGFGLSIIAIARKR